MPSFSWVVRKELRHPTKYSSISVCLVLSLVRSALAELGHFLDVDQLAVVPKLRKRSAGF